MTDGSFTKANPERILSSFTKADSANIYRLTAVSFSYRLFIVLSRTKRRTLRMVSRLCIHSIDGNGLCLTIIAFIIDTLNRVAPNL